MPSNNKISVVTLLQAYRLLTNVITYQFTILPGGLQAHSFPRSRYGSPDGPAPFGPQAEDMAARLDFAPSAG